MSVGATLALVCVCWGHSALCARTGSRAAARDLTHAAAHALSRHEEGARSTGRPAAGSPRAPGSLAGPIRVLLLGDSLVATELGLELQGRLNSTSAYTCRRRARSATGLARQDVFDWIRAARQAVAFRRPELVLVMIGSNDAQDVVPPRRGRRRASPFRRVNWGTPGWAAAYRARVDRLLEQVTSPSREVLWMELPPMRSRRLDQKLLAVRRVQRAAVLARSREADLLEILPLMRGVGGGAEKWRRAWRPLRRDGVHFGRKGGRLLARMILPVIHAMALRVFLHRLQEEMASPKTWAPRHAR